MQRVTVLYSGRVQGVGFRATIRHLACGYDVTGFVRNLPDGRVELIAEGAKPELKAFLEGIAESELSGFIAKHCAIELLRHGYTVRGTVRSAGRRRVRSTQRATSSSTLAVVAAEKCG